MDIKNRFNSRKGARDGFTQPLGLEEEWYGFRGALPLRQFINGLCAALFHICLFGLVFFPVPT